MRVRVGGSGATGPVGATGAQGPQGLPGTDGLATADVFADHVELPGAGRTALLSLLGERVHEAVVDGDDLADAVAATPVGGSLLVTEGTYTLPVGGLQLDQAIKLLFRGDVTLHQPVGSNPGIVVSADDVVLDSDMPVLITGIQRTVYAAEECGVRVEGASAADPIRRFSARGIACNTWGHAGFYLKWVDGFTFRECTTEDTCYMGFEVTSGLNGTFDDCHATDVGPGVSGNAYGFTATREGVASLVTDPKSANITYTRCTATDVPLWHGFDTHAADNVKWIDCDTYNCKRGMAINTSVVSGTQTYASHDFLIKGGVLDSGVTDGTREAGILITGVANSYGAGTDPCTGRVEGVTVKGHGDASISLGCAVYVRNTKAVRLDNLIVIEGARSAVLMDFGNENFAINGLSTQDTWTNSGAAAAVLVSSQNGFNTGSIAGVTAARGSKSATTVNQRMISVGTLNVGTDIKVGTNNDPSGFSSPVAALDGIVRGSVGALLVAEVSGLPIRGVWPRGAQLWYSSAAAAGSPGWVCTTAGALANSTAWAATTAYTQGSWRKTSTGKVFEVKIAGTSSGSEPTATTLGEEVVDGTVTWIYRSATTAVFKAMPAVAA